MNEILSGANNTSLTISRGVYKEGGVQLAKITCRNLY